MKSHRSFRSFVFWLHTWCGLNIAIYLGVLFLSGTLLALAPEIEAVFDGDRRAEGPRGPLPVAAIYDNIQTKWPASRIERIERSSSGFVADRTALLTPWGEKLRVWTDPGTGEITGLSGKLGFKEVLRSFHDSLLTQRGIGTLLVTISAPILTILIVTGLISYRRFWRGFFRLPPRNAGPRAFWGAMHRLTALWSLPFMILTALTSLYFFLGTLGTTSYFYPKPAAPAERIRPLPEGFNGARLQQAVTIAADEIPELVTEVVVLPVFPGQSLIVQGQADAWFVRARANKVTLDPSDLSVIGSFRAEDLNVSTRIREASDSLHFGIWGGTLTRVLWFVFGALVTSLCVFGALVYARRMSRPDTPAQAGAMRMIWRGMFPLKWLLPLGLILGLGAGTYLIVSKKDRWSRVPAFEQPLQADGAARLFARGKLRVGQTLPLRLRLEASDVPQVTVSRAGQDPEVVKLVKNGDWYEAHFGLPARAGDNPVTITLPDGVALIWQLGRPVF